MIDLAFLGQTHRKTAIARCLSIVFIVLVMLSIATAPVIAATSAFNALDPSGQSSHCLECDCLVQASHDCANNDDCIDLTCMPNVFSAPHQHSTLAQANAKAAYLSNVTLKPFDIILPLESRPPRA